MREAFVDGGARGEGLDEGSLRVDLAARVGVVEIVGQDGFEAGLVAGFGGGEALVVGGGECRAEPFAFVGEGGGGRFFGGSREGRDEGESQRTRDDREQRAEGEFHEARN
jgi:hypothetical protein